MKLRQFVLQAAVVAAMLSGSLPATAQWSQVESGTTDDLYRVQFPSRDTGYIRGSTTVLKTIDGGKTWASVLSFPLQFNPSIPSMFFKDNLTGFFAGSEGMLRTDDGGATWTTVEALPAGANVWFVRDNLWFCLLNDDMGISMTRSTDQGLTWEAITGIENQPGRNGICFPTADTGYAVYRSGLLRTIDTGKTWTEIISYNTDENFPFSILETCYFTDAATGYIGGWYNGTLSKTADGGTNWKHAAEYQLFDITFLTKTTGYAAGWYGMIYTSTDGGNSWEPQQTGLETGYSLYDLYFTDENTGFAVGDHGTILRKTAGTSTSVPELSLAAHVTVSSDPATGQLVVHLTDGQYQSVHIELFSSMGQRVYRNDFTGSEHHIDLASRGLSSGMYFLRLLVDGVQVTKQVAIVR